MATDTSNTNAKLLQHHENKNIEVNNILNNDLNSNTEQSEETHINIECIKEENEKTPTKKHNGNINLQINSSNNKEKTNLESYNNNHKVTYNTRSSLIRIRKMEDLCKTPEKDIDLNESIDIKDIKIEGTYTSEKFSPSMLITNSVESNSMTIKVLQESPTPSKKRKHLEENNTPNKQKKRKSSDSEDYYQLPVTLKTDLYDNTPNDMEHIVMLHDLDSVMDFEDTKIPSFLSSGSNDMENKENMEISKDPQVDPLLIDNNELKDAVTENINIKQVNKTVKSIHNSRAGRKKVTDSNNCIKYTRQTKLSCEKRNNTHNRIKTELKVLNSPSGTEDEEISESDRQRLYDLKVQIMHNIPPQHKIERTAGSRALTKAEKQLFLEYTLLRKGVFLPREDKLIIDNWKEFCKVHNWNPKIVKPFLYMKYGPRYSIKSTEDRQKFVQFLANGLPWRSLYSVHQRFKNIFEKCEKPFKRYTSAEDEKILLYMKKKQRNKSKTNKKFTKLAQILGRKTRSVRVRYKLLKQMQKSHTGRPISEVKWTLPLISIFLKAFLDVTLSEEVRELKNAKIPKLIWMKLEEKLNIDYEVLQKFWIHQLHMQFVYGKGISNTREITWPNVAKYFEGVTTIFLCKIFCHLVHAATVKTRKTNFLEIMEYLYHCKIHDIHNSSTDRFLPRLSYDKGQVTIIDENIE
ncbi:hypothetical protein WN55_02648 [Dufourea novaeangliae]|uniref:Myb-like domain-containing protein n=1 Tax=Dufourea novaeangliae TaxID=178035 RepID=A0A154PHR0_DUFNO|nr:hypothetical protein WN55_02648 [Dufourea novaeangliae]